MENIESRLREYRLRRRRQEKLQNLKENFKRLFMIGKKDTTGQDSESIVIQENDLDKEIDSTTSDPDCVDCLKGCDNDSGNESNNEYRCLKYALWLVYFLFWITLYVIAIELQFGIVYLMISALVGIYCNTRTGKRLQGEISAYSVFNKNCESIDGTLKAEQFEREMGIR
uniref:SAYSvFN domain-containing protein n=1 Tax=Glossina brevipalpis TaxID=37001 RepID=A0A1A9W7E0_9MUSC